MYTWLVVRCESRWRELRFGDPPGSGRIFCRVYGLFFPFFLLVSLTIPAVAQRHSSGVRFNNKPLTSREWSGLNRVDLDGLEEEVRKRGLDIPDDQLSNQLRRNFRFIFVNKLNTQRFLVRPTPERVAQSILAILTAESRMRDLLTEARELHGSRGGPTEPHPRPDCRRNVDQITRATQELRKLFRENFVEVKSATFNINLPGKRGVQDPVPMYLNQAERIHIMLKSRIDRYFFGPAPGSVSVADFEDVSVSVLADALIQLGRRVVKML